MCSIRKLGFIKVFTVFFQVALRAGKTIEYIEYKLKQPYNR